MTKLPWLLFVLYTGPKIYSFNSANDSGGPANLDKSILKVSTEILSHFKKCSLWKRRKKDILKYKKIMGYLNFLS